MKKLYTVFACIFMLNFYCKAQFVDLANDDFRTFLLGKYPACFNGLGQLDTTCTAITIEDSLTYHANTDFYISLVPIQYFDALQYLDISYSIIDVSYQLPQHLPSTLLSFKCDHIVHIGGNGSPIHLSILPAGLQYLNYSNCPLDVSGGSAFWPTALKYLDVSHTQTSTLGILPPTLDTLICNNAGIIPDNPPTPDFAFPTLTALPTLPSTLRYLNCSNLGLSSLPALPAGLTWLNCSNNYSTDGSDYRYPILTSLPALPATLEYLSCNNNRLSNLPALPASLKYLDCSANKFYHIYYLTMTDFVEYDYTGFTNLPALPSTLQYLNCGGNSLTSLPALPPVLNYLNVDARNFFDAGSGYAVPYNHISSLPILPPTLAYLNCKWNNLTCLPHLPASMGGQSSFSTDPYNLVLDYTQVNCIPNSVPGIRLAGAWPLCNVVNNTNACEIDPIIGGNVFYDNNSNGIQDAGELPRANVRVDYSTGLQTFTDINGHYEGTADIGSNTVTIVPPVYYNAVPATLTHTVSAPNTLITDLVALQPNTLVDSLKITMVGESESRPGFDFVYYVKYENVGTTVLNPNIVIHLDHSPSVSYTGSYGAVLIQNNDTLSLSLGQFAPGQKGEFRIYFIVDFSAQMNDYMVALATFSGGASITSDEAGTIINNSWDPNEKQATKSLTTQQLADGTYINYTILFQNTGTASALNIFLTDTLSALLQATTLQMLESSHACRITQAGNKLLFEFININLPDSNHNEPESHGYVRFRIKPLASLTNGTVIPNGASIYFDYNSAVLTNTAITNIDDIVIPINLGSFNARKQNATVQLYWSTEQENNSKSFVIERSSTGNKWDIVTSVPAAGNSSQKINYTTTDFNPAKGVNYYRLKQIDLDGKFVYSEIRSVYFSNDANMVLVPNPAVDKLIVYLPGNTTTVSINIYNLNGQLVKQLSSNEEAVQISVAGLSRGVYSVRVNGRNVNEVRKLVVQ